MPEYYSCIVSINWCARYYPSRERVGDTPFNWRVEMLNRHSGDLKVIDTTYLTLQLARNAAENFSRENR